MRFKPIFYLAATGLAALAVAALLIGATGVGLLLLGVLGCGAIAVAAWRLPNSQAARWKARGVLEPTELAKVENDSRATVLQAFAAFGLIGTLALTAYQVSEARRSAADNLRISERGQVADRFARAIDQLGARNADGTAATDIRTGALFSLLTIGTDSDRDTFPAATVVASYVANNIRTNNRAIGSRTRMSDACSPERQAARRRLPADVETALAVVLPVLSEKALQSNTSPDAVGYTWKEESFDGTRLDGLSFYGAFLDGVSFQDADLRGANFQGSFLSHVDFRDACLVSADFRGVKGSDSIDLRGANLELADVPDEFVAKRAVVDETTKGLHRR